MKRRDGVWLGPETAPFSGHYSDVDISFSPDGKLNFFERHNCRERGLSSISSEIFQRHG